MSTTPVERDPHEAPDGSWQIVLARPGGRLTESKLARTSFAHWPLLWPETPETSQRRGSMPPAPSQLAGEVIESHWDPARRAVVGTVSVVEKLADLLRRIPNTLRLLLSAPPGALMETAGEHGHFVVMSRGGRGGGATSRLLEAAVSAVDPEPRRSGMEGLRVMESASVVCIAPESELHAFRRDLVSSRPVAQESTPRQQLLESLWPGHFGGDAA